MAEQYGSHLGREFLDPFKISDLSELVRQGRAASVSEAIEVYKSSHS